MTVSISYSPSKRSSVSRSRMSPRTILTRSSMPVRTSSLCGTQSRTRHTTSAPAATNRRTSHDPTRPVPPVTKVGRSSQNTCFKSMFSMEHSLPATSFPIVFYHAAYPYIARNLHDGKQQVDSLEPVVLILVTPNLLRRRVYSQILLVPLP